MSEKTGTINQKIRSTAPDQSPISLGQISDLCMTLSVELFQNNNMFKNTKIINAEYPYMLTKISQNM
jgi:hypothetical protein